MGLTMDAIATVVQLSTQIAVTVLPQSKAAHSDAPNAFLDSAKTSQAGSLLALHAGILMDPNVTATVEFVTRIAICHTLEVETFAITGQLQAFKA